mmetsp:Transcript_11629/g.14666  ORF Transcript_11629/g.14666 Transcript_11629/m.14666 type:complete len:200 (+) Transcript_11629:88-687(+)|eukprot:CAMPEP_0203668328 /NCGR_PEP_ID=MMETSP0090-20130426/4979_1 /ASSEMBLY_ACC=CAM_ASM_001088 /TAXON_ID=426623 /ORGANISM="Chaetoceros affinis, Strain CCMP159" /LENGTH=199 /DNA_ID=CAMNT_0050532729 /DNA_START=124 /DNA_END=723 /DNA_ORIENTATION=+
MSDKDGSINEIVKKLGSDYAENNPLSSSANVSPYLKKAWSDDESTVASLSVGQQYVRRRGVPSRTSYDDSTILSTNSSQSATKDVFNFYNWLDYTKSLTDLVSKQINDCTSGPEEYETKDTGFTLKDEEFFWSPNANSYDTADTRRTNDLLPNPISKMDQHMKNQRINKLWDSDRTQLVKNTNNVSFQEQDAESRDSFS